MSTGKYLGEVGEANSFSGKPVTAIAFAPDGKLLAMALGSPWNPNSTPDLALWEVASGKKLRPLVGQKGPVLALAFTPDGHTLATSSDDGIVRLWHVATGQERQQMRLEIDSAECLTISGDGKTLAGGTHKGSVYLWEVATGAQRQQFIGHRGMIRCVAFSPDNRMLASGSRDTTILVWDVTGLKGAGRLGQATSLPKQGEQLWTELGSADASEAYQAMWLLTVAPEQTLRLLQEHLRPIAAVGTPRIAQLVADLGNDRFAVRQKAQAELEELGDLAEESLREVLASNPVLEVRRRVEMLLKRLDPSVSPERLRALRAVEVLEHISTAPAQQFLEKLAKGDDKARLTKEARAALQRRAKQSPEKP